ncbi:hypothetical protein [Aquimarina sp. MMG016]|uniref:hypothetical protein n=1 Tax=Aquimarina sp. MMG016 TaxID=2822690 RepID=UPI001B3A1819|nr:hypothetical protein [Aquimarina sp. MMG016]MBQ4820553.1 hypothetical protein [Aquimarina sp. MMG016]
MSEVFTYNNIDLKVSQVDKNKLKSIIPDSKFSFGKNLQTSLVRSCLSYDQKIIKKCNICLEDNSLPIDVLEILTRLNTSLIFNGIEGDDIIEELRKKEYEKEQLRFFRLQSGYS